MNETEKKEKSEEKNSCTWKIVTSVIITFLITVCVTVFVYGKYLEKSGVIIQEFESSDDIADCLDVIRTMLEQTYKGEIDDEQLEESAIKGYVEGLGDDYTEYMTQEEYEELNSSLSDYVGIGVYLGEMKDTKQSVIIGLIGDDSPAAKAGLQAGDIIKEVNLEDVTDKGTEYVSSKVKGLENTTVKITVLRGEEELTFDIVREKVKMYEIKSKMLEGNVGYIDFDSFTDTSYDEFKTAYESLKSQGAESLIVDLRDNTGGYVTSALSIANMFVDDDKTLLITEDKDGNRTTEKSTGDKVIDIPVVVLVNDYSASASEILTGILKDYDIATIVGTTTYGKGVIQTIYPNVLDGALKVTVAEYYTPNGNKINEIGIEPDEVVEEDEEATETTEDNDAQLQKAIEILKN